MGRGRKGANSSELLKRKPGLYQSGPYTIMHGPTKKYAPNFIFITAMKIMLEKGYKPSPELEAGCRRFAQNKYDEITAEQKSLGIPKQIRQLFAAEAKAEVEKLARVMTVTGREFVSVLLNARDWGFKYQPLFREFVPKGLPRLGTIERLEEGGYEVAGPKPDDPQKAFGQMNRLFAERRYNSIHWLSRREKWHCFYFSFEDIKGEHWSEGSHLHYISFLWGMPKTAVRDKLKERNISLPSVHIRYEEAKQESGIHGS